MYACADARNPIICRVTKERIPGQSVSFSIRPTVLRDKMLSDSHSAHFIRYSAVARNFFFVFDGKFDLVAILNCEMYLF